MARHQKRSFGEILLAGGSKVGGVNVLMRDANERIIMASGSSLPTVGTAGFAVGCQFILTGAATGRQSLWINRGTTSASSFTPIGNPVGYGFNWAGQIACSNGVTAFTSVTNAPYQPVLATDIAYGGYGVSDDNDQILAVISANNAVTATLSADPLAAHSLNLCTLRLGCFPSWSIYAAGKHTTVAGQVYNDITVSGINASDMCFVCYSASDDSDVISKAAYQSANTMRVTMSADPLTAHELSYFVLRPTGSFVPSHYVFAAGVHTTVGGAVAEAITVSGALATDIPFVCYNTTDDTDTLVKSVVTANTLTVTMSANPLTAHKLAYMLLRAY